MKRYGLRSTGETDTHDYFDKDLSRKGAAPATGRDTLIKLQGRVARKLDTHASENRLAGLPTRITRITCRANSTSAAPLYTAMKIHPRSLSALLAGDG